MRLYTKTMGTGDSANIFTVFAVWLTVFIVGAGSQRPPNYHHDHMPNTSFSCDGKVVGGYYADPEAYCQMFHVCVQVDENDIRDFRFMCPDDTVFDQENFICANWFEIDCKASTVHYDKNLNLFHPEDESKTGQKGIFKGTSPINPEEISEQLRRQQEQQKQQLLLLEQQQQQLLFRQQQILDRHEKQQQEHQQKQLKIVAEQQRQQLALRPPEGRKVPSASETTTKVPQVPTTTKAPEYEETTVEYDYYYYDYDEENNQQQQGQFFINDEYDPNAPTRLVEPTNSKHPPALPVPVTNSKGSNKSSGTRKSR